MRKQQHHRLVQALIVACLHAPSLAGQPVPSASTPPAIVAWFDCVECTAAQLAAVRALGDQAVPELTEVLRNGPPAARLGPQRTYLERRWQTLKNYEQTHADQRVPLNQQDYVLVYLEKYALVNRARAARGLGAINTPAAQTALQQALQLPNLPDVLRREINKALTPP